MDSAQNFKKEVETAYEFVDENYKPEEIYGESGAQILRCHAARASHPEMPYGMAVEAGLCSCTNGASSESFPGVSAYLSLVFMNVNVPQCRKSQLNMALEKLSKVKDQKALVRAKAQLRENWEEGDGPDPARNAAVKSTTMTSFAEAAFFQRASGDFSQLARPDPTETIEGRFDLANLLNLDEAYKFIKMLGHVAQSASGKGIDANSVPDAASEFNRLLQTGRSALATKTAGTFGEGDAPPTNTCGVGNVHPSVYIPILRGDTGSNHVASKERLLEGTGRPVEPHSALPLSLETPADFKRWMWSPLLSVMIEPLGLPRGADKPDVADRIFTRARASPEDPDDEDEDENDFHPNKRGYQITLADGCPTLMRFRIMKEPWICVSVDKQRK